MEKIYKSVKVIEKEYQEWIQNYPDYYMYPIAPVNRIFEHDKWKFFKRQAKKHATSKIEFLRILLIIKMLYSKIN